VILFDLLDLLVSLFSFLQKKKTKIKFSENNENHPKKQKIKKWLSFSFSANIIATTAPELWNKQSGYQIECIYISNSHKHWKHQKCWKTYKSATRILKWNNHWLITIRLLWLDWMTRIYSPKQIMDRILRRLFNKTKFDQGIFFFFFILIELRSGTQTEIKKNKHKSTSHLIKITHIRRKKKKTYLPKIKIGNYLMK
jgi:hypothetical protein